MHFKCLFIGRWKCAYRTTTWNQSSHQTHFCYVYTICMKKNGRDLRPLYSCHCSSAVFNGNNKLKIEGRDNKKKTNGNDILYERESRGFDSFVIFFCCCLFLCVLLLEFIEKNVCCVFVIRKINTVTSIGSGDNTKNRRPDFGNNWRGSAAEAATRERCHLATVRRWRSLHYLVQC